MFYSLDWIDDLESTHTREMILQHLRMANDISWTLITLQQDSQDPDFDRERMGPLYAAQTALSEAVKWLRHEGYHLRRESLEWSRGGDGTQRGLIDRSIAKLECAYKVIAGQYIELARLGILKRKTELEGPSAKTIQDLIDLSKF